MYSCRPDQPPVMAVASNMAKTVIITGASSGIGLMTAKKLCQQGFDVIFACRNLNKGQDAMDCVTTEFPTARASLMQIDVSDLSSVRSFATHFKGLNKPLYALVNNAGITFRFQDTDRKISKDGYELTMATNYIGHFLLTHLLLDDLKKAAEQFGEARIISVTSSLHDPENIKRHSKNNVINELRLDDFNLERAGSYCGLQAYKNSKAALIMFMYELSWRLEGTRVTANCVCPGFVPTTDLGRSNPYLGVIFLKFVLPTVAYFLGRPFVTSLDEAGRRVSRLVSDQECQGLSGVFYKDDEESTSQGNTNDVELQHSLYELSQRLVQL